MGDLSFWNLPAGYFRSFAVPTTAASKALDPTGAIRLGGWSFAETTGLAPASIELWDGSATGGATIAVINLAAGVSATKSLPGLGLLLQSGVFLSVTAGSVRGSIWAAPALPRDIAAALSAAGL